jgi:hypothetical protein
MAWENAYILIRVDENLQARVVHSANTLKDARYWLQYIAEPGDALFTTPVHPKYSGDGKPAYMSHLLARGKIEYAEEKWKAQVTGGQMQIQLPEPPA